MQLVVPLMLCAIFFLLAGIHTYWAIGGAGGKFSAVPHIDDKPVFRPSPAATFAVAIGLALCGVLIASVCQLISLPISHIVLVWLSYALALGLLMRAIGDFRLVGFFKRVRGSHFAKLDTQLFSPLCLVLSAGVFFIAATH